MSSESCPLKVTLLGTGTSTGIPVIGCRCRVCTSDDPRDRRTRCACHVEYGDLSIVIDTGPDFRQQALREGIRQVDAVLYTHHHFDHIVGLDDLRPYFFNNPNPIPCYGHPATVDVIDRMFPYIFADGTYPGVPRLSLYGIREAFEVVSRHDAADAVQVVPLEVYHGDLLMYGYRIGDFAYLTDTSHIPEQTLSRLGGLEVLVLDALRHEKHPTHFNIEEAVEAANRIGARETYFIHMTHTLMHAEEEERLPSNVHLGFDGLSLELSI